MSAANYQIKIAGVQVTDANKDNITGTGITGTVKFLPEYRRIILTNATIKATGSDYGIYIGYSGDNDSYEICVNGTCNVESVDAHAIAFCSRKNNQISSQGSGYVLNAKSTNKSAIYTQGNLDVSISRGTINATSTNGDYGIYDVNLIHTFTVGYAQTVNATAKKAGIYGFTSMSINSDACISSPRSAVFKSSEKTIVTYATGTTPATKVTIEPGYPIWVNGKHVTKDNASNVLGDNYVSYNSTGKTLTFAGGSYTCPSSECAIEAYQDLTVDVLDISVSFNQTQSTYAGIFLGGGHKYKFKGFNDKGTINVKSTGQPAITLADGSSLEFDHITANITTTSHRSINGLRGNNTVTFSNSNATVDGTSYTPIGGDITSCTFNDCSIKTPSGVTYSASNKALVQNGSTYTGKVTIAPTSYGITIAGTEVNSRNLSALGYGVSFAPSTYTISLSNVDIGCSGNGISIINASKPVTILLNGSNRIVSNTANGIYIANTNVTIKNFASNASLYVESQYTGTNAYAPINSFSSGDLTITGCSINTKAKDYAIKGNSFGYFTIENSTIDANITSNSLYHGALEGCKYIYLNGATIKSTATGIYSKDVTPAVSLTGSSTITSPNEHGIFWEGVAGSTATISSTSNGSLSISAPHSGNCGIMFKPNITIKDCSVSFTGGSSAVVGQSGTSTLTIDNATVTAKAGSGTASEGAIEGITALTLKNGIDIISPTGAKYNSSLKGISADGSTLCQEVKIGVKEYGITINDVKVTSKNYTNIPAVSSGSAKYDPTTKVLTLSNATINATKFGMTIDEEITLKLVGTNTISSSSNCITARKTSFTVDGGGTGKLNLKSTDGPGIYAVQIPMTIKDCTVESESADGIIGLNNHEKALTIENANVHVKATGSTGRAFVNYSSVTLKDCYIESPSGADYDGSLMSIAKDGTTCKEVTIKAGTNPHTIAPTVSNKDIAVIAATSSSLKLSWTAASDNLTPANKLRYHLTCSNASEYYDLEVTGGVTTAEFTGLKPETDYTIRMRAYDEDGYWVAYNDKPAKTIAYVDDVKPTLPTDPTISVTALTYNSVSIHWNAASDNITTADNIEYQVAWAVKDLSTGSVAFTKGTTDIEIKNLEPETTYEIDVAAFDEAGNYIDYTTLEVTTLAAPDVTAPVLPADASITVDDLTATTATISWYAATDDKTVENNMVYEIEVTDSHGTHIYSVTGETTYTITGLDPETEYSIKVWAIDEAGNQSVYDAKTITTYAESDITSPTLPSDQTITVTEVTDNSISIKWNAATDDKTAEADMRYMVECFANGSWELKGFLAGTTEYVIVGLDASTEYKIRITAMDEANNMVSYPEVSATTSAISAIEAILAKYPDAKMYNLNGVLVDKNYRGIVIINGKKYRNK